MKSRRIAPPSAHGTEIRRSSNAVVTLLGCAVLFSSTAALAAPGDIDPTYQSQVRYINPGFPEATSSALQSDGKLLLAGDINSGTSTNPQRDIAMLRQLGGTGGADTTFAGGGVEITHIGSSATGYQNMITGMVEAPSENILASGWDTDPSTGLPDAVMLRYLPSGSIDPSYGNGGAAFFASPTSQIKFQGLALQHDLKSVVAGYIKTGTANQQILVARYTTAGVLDTTFGNSGQFVVPTSAMLSGNGLHVAVQPDGKIVVVGHARRTSSDTNDSSVVLRLTANGVVDTTFGSGGYSFLSNGLGTGEVAIQPDGKIIFSSYTGDVTRLNTNGSLDTTFGFSGTAVTFGNGLEIALLPTGQILMAVTVLTNTSPVTASYWVTRLTSQGAIDTTFTDSSGQSGTIKDYFNLGTITTSTPLSSAGGLAVGPDGKFYVSGQATVNGTDNYFMMTRYNGDPLVLNPATVKFNNLTGVPLSTVETSGAITVSGLTSGAWVPVTVASGHYSINGGAFVTTTGYARNGDQITVRHTSAATSATIVTTTLHVGGMYAQNNNATLLGSYLTLAFSSTTK